MQSTDTYKHLAWQNRIKMMFFFGILISLGFVIFAIKGLLLSVVIAMIISYLLSPMVAKLETKGLSRFASTSIVFFSFTLLLVGLGIAISPFLARQISSLQGEIPKYIDGSIVLVQRWQATIHSFSNGMIDLKTSYDFRSWIEGQSKILLLNLPQYLSSSASVLFLSPFIGFFLIKDGRSFARGLLEIVPNSIFEMTLNLQYQINDQIAHYLRARIFEAAIVGLVVFLGLVSIGFPYASVLSIFAGVTNLIPYIGPIVGAIPAIVIAVVNHDSQIIPIIVISIYAVAQLIDMFILIPLLVAKIVDLHPITVIVAVIIGAQLLGVLGMLISIPIFSAIKVTSITVYRHLTDFS